MPIRTAIPIIKPTEQEFYELDHRVTGFAFQIHNEYGRLLDEEIYKCELARRCEQAGLPVVREMQVTFTHAGFRKDYFADLMIRSGLPVEAKATEQLVGANTAQTLGYLFACDLEHGTLLNFRPPKVEHEFVSTRLNTKERRRIRVHDDRWERAHPEMQSLQKLMLELLHDWGAYLEVPLYREALAFLISGQEKSSRRVEVFSGESVIGVQPVNLLTDDVAFSVTAVTRSPQQMEGHLQRFLNHTRLEAIAWINLHHADITFTTLRKAK